MLLKPTDPWTYKLQGLKSHHVYNKTALSKTASQTQTICHAWGNFTHFWGYLFFHNPSPHQSVIRPCRDFPSPKHDRASVWLKQNNQRISTLRFLVRVNYPTENCSFSLGCDSTAPSTLLCWFYILLSFSFSADSSPVPPAVLHQSLLKPHNFMFTLRVTVKIFFLWTFRLKVEKCWIVLERHLSVEFFKCHF